jgi:hypothetical protein
MMSGMTNTSNTARMISIGNVKRRGREKRAERGSNSGHRPMAKMPPRSAQAGTVEGDRPQAEPHRNGNQPDAALNPRHHRRLRFGVGVRMGAIVDRASYDTRSLLPDGAIPVELLYPDPCILTPQPTDTRQCVGLTPLDPDNERKPNVVSSGAKGRNAPATAAS